MIEVGSQRWNPEKTVKGKVKVDEGGKKNEHFFLENKKKIIMVK